MEAFDFIDSAWRNAYGMLTPAEAVEQGALELSGDATLFDQFAASFSAPSSPALQI